MKIKPISFFLLASILWFNCSEIKTESAMKEKIFIESIDPNSGRILIIEEDEFSIWAYILNSENKGIEFDGYLCSVVNPSEIKLNPSDIAKMGVAPPLTDSFSNSFSFVKNIEKEKIEINWTNNGAEIRINKELYLIMDLTNKISYSKSLNQDCVYGKAMKID